jgi:hypothetical protein
MWLILDGSLFTNLTRVRSARSRASTDLPRPQILYRMGQQLLRGAKESNGVRQLRVQLKRGFIGPLGMNSE